MRRVKKLEKSRFWSRDLWLLTMVAPGTIWLLLIRYLPMLGVVIAFKDYKIAKGIWGSEWVGMKNFEAFFGSTNFLNVTYNTVFLNALFIIATMLFSILGLVCFLNSFPRRKKTNIPMLALTFAMLGILIFCDIYYIIYCPKMMNRFQNIINRDSVSRIKGTGFKNLSCLILRKLASLNMV